MDAARVLPFLGLFLFLLPLLWEDAAGAGQATAFEGLYLFAVWAGLILGAAVLARGLAEGLDDPPAGADRPGPAETPPAEPAPDGARPAETGAASQ